MEKKFQKEQYSRNTQVKSVFQYLTFKLKTTSRQGFLNDKEEGFGQNLDVLDDFFCMKTDPDKCRSLVMQNHQ